MKISKPLILLATLSTFATWFYFLLLVPTFDFDESLYRRVTQSMMNAHNPWLLTWDRWPLFHKPPIFYWLIWLSHLVFDQSTTEISSFASRIPSLLSTVAILFLLSWAPGYILNGPQSKKLSWSAPLAFMMTLFPVITATAVIFDPLQTLALMPALLVLTRLFVSNGELGTTEWAAIAVSMSLASAIKGLNGLIIPSFAFGVQWFWSFARSGSKKSQKVLLKFFGYAIAPSLVLLAMYFYWLDQNIGRAFTHEFLWMQHFARTQIPMENHSGGMSYHPLVVFLGGGLLIPFLINLTLRQKINFEKWGFPITYTCAFILVFGLSATKLPHYTWPVWPAIALWVGILSDHKNQFTQKRMRQIEIADKIALAPLFLLGVVLISLAFAPTFLFQLFSHSPAGNVIASQFTGFHSLEKLSLLISGLLCFYFLACHKKFFASLEKSASLASLITLFLVLGLAPQIKKLMVDPFYDIIGAFNLQDPNVSDCIRYSGASSATLSLALGNVFLHNRCEPEDMRFLITPLWKSHECAERKMKVITQKSYLVLCENPSRRR